MLAVSTIHEKLGVREACAAVGLARATWYRAQAPSSCKTPGSPSQTRPRTTSSRALSSVERQRVLDLVHEPRFVDLAVPQVWATALDEGTYLCSRSTMYRILQAQGEVRERRDQLRRPVYTKPELLATGPNQVWTWDITKLKGPTKWSYFHLYVILDIFSRKVVGWMVARGESAALARKLIAATIAKEGIVPGQLTIHADRGSSMTSKDVALLMADLGVTKTHSRPHVSNDNPYSESHFKTVKYRPDFPERFGSLEDARAFCARFFDWYNNHHRHSGIGWMTPGDVHHGRAVRVRAERARALEAAYQLHPERFVRKPPTPPALPTTVWINPPAAKPIAVAQ
jgi:putative transposase